MRIFLSDRAHDDLDEIWLYIAHDHPDAAQRMIAHLVEKMSTLTDLPLSGRARPELGKDLRSIPCGNYIIIYHLLEDAIGIARVIHGSRDLGDQTYPHASPNDR